ncbi:MAG: WbqC family protein [Bacteroidales bacterium]|nr:WbqC family protein [Bacteroidales bacterium]
MSSLALLSTAYLPPTDYFRVINSFADWKIEQWENYQKQSYRSRCRIYSANGPLSLHIPIVRSEGFSIPVKEIRVDNSKRWQSQHWRAIVSAYRSSPYFEHYQQDLLPFYSREYEYLFEFNKDLTKCLLDLLDLPAKIDLTDEFLNKSDLKRAIISDFRETIHPKRVSPFAELNEKGRYHQVFAHKFGFFANLSVIDLLFNEGPESKYFL